MLRRVFVGGVHFGDNGGAIDGRARAAKWNCAPSPIAPQPWVTLVSSARTETTLLGVFSAVNGPLRHSRTPKRQLRVAPKARSGVVAWTGAVGKRRPYP